MEKEDKKEEEFGEQIGSDEAQDATSEEFANEDAPEMDSTTDEGVPAEETTDFGERLGEADEVEAPDDFEAADTPPEEEFRY